MDIRLGIGRFYSQVSWYSSGNQRPFKPCCSKRDSPPPPPEQNGDRGDKYSTDWDKAWTSFKKQGRKTFFSQFSPDKYVSWNPRRSEFPLSEEVDPIKRTERSNLRFWTSPSFTLAASYQLQVHITQKQMAKNEDYAKSPKKHKVNHPPKRGQIKINIFRQVVKKLSQVFKVEHSECNKKAK
ncbi:Uncharacterized protein Fot_28377 [Forsythia ovata]|uniref:Uncharacterized protein n=1 Tax=Forsythia ovata TaxID=205694 RepID=A0ABD1TNV9_9LAMI